MRLRILVVLALVSAFVFTPVERAWSTNPDAATHLIRTLGDKAFVLKRPTKLCLAASVDGVPAQSPTTHLLCYGVKGLKRANPDAVVHRKSGTWREHHSDGALVEDGDVVYVAVGLSTDPDSVRDLPATC